MKLGWEHGIVGIPQHEDREGKRERERERPPKDPPLWIQNFCRQDHTSEYDVQQISGPVERQQLHLTIWCMKQRHKVISHEIT